MKTIPSAALIIGCFFIFSEANWGRFSNQCTDPRTSLPQEDTRFKLSVGTDYNQLQTDRPKQFYEGSIQDYFKEKPEKKFLGMKYFIINHAGLGRALDIQYGVGLNAPGYLHFSSGAGAIFTLHQDVSEGAESARDANYYVRCVSQCNGWEGYYLSYSTTEIGAVGYVWLSKWGNAAAFIVGDNGELAFKGQNSWYLDKNGWIQTWDKNKGEEFQLFEIEGAKLPKTFLTLNQNGYMYTTNNEEKASEFVMAGTQIMKCVANCYGFEDYYRYPVKMDDHGRIKTPDIYQYWYINASYGGLNESDDYVRKKEGDLAQQFCVEVQN